MSRRSTPRAVLLGPVLGLLLVTSTVAPAAASTTGTGPLTVIGAASGVDESPGPDDLATALPSPSAEPDATVGAGPTATISDPQPLREEEVTALGSGFTPGEEVTAELPARLRGQLGRAVARPDGTVSITVQAPMALQAGAHEVLLRGTSGATASTSIQLRPLVEDRLARLARWWPSS